MQRYRFRFSSRGNQAGDTVDFDHASDDDAMCEAARTAAEMLKGQVQTGPALSGFLIDVFGSDGRAIGGIEIAIRTAVPPL